MLSVCTVPVDVGPVLLAVLHGGGELLLEDAGLAPQLHVALSLRPQNLRKTHSNRLMIELGLPNRCHSHQRSVQL